MRTRYLAAALVVVFVAGCSTGPRKPPPCVRQPEAAASLTVRRVSSVVGAPATMFLVINRERIYGLWHGDSYSLRLDPGVYAIGYDLGFNECRKRVTLQPRRSYLISMAPGCRIEVQDLNDPCYRGF
jgi:hypothetical protein